MHELELNRSSHLIDPALHIWGWEIPVYLFLGGVTAGVMILTPLLLGRLPKNEQSRALRLMPFAAPLLLSLGMFALFLDLSYKLHVLRFYGAFRWSSPMSWGAWILVFIYPASVLLGVAGMDQTDIHAAVKAAPKGLARLFGKLLRMTHKFAEEYQRPIWIANVVLGIALGGYTGLLLGTLGVRNAWNSAIMAPLFLVSGVSTGAALIMLAPLANGERHFLRNLDIGAIGLELALIAVYLLGLITGSANSKSAAYLFLGGPYTAVFWALVVIAGLIIPLVLESMEARRALRHTAWAPVLLLIGGLVLRWVIVYAGQA